MATRIFALIQYQSGRQATNAHHISKDFQLCKQISQSCILVYKYICLITINNSFGNAFPLLPTLVACVNYYWAHLTQFTQVATYFTVYSFKSAIVMNILFFPLLPTSSRYWKMQLIIWDKTQYSGGKVTQSFH